MEYSTNALVAALKSLDGAKSTFSVNKNFRDLFGELSLNVNKLIEDKPHTLVNEVGDALLSKAGKLENLVDAKISDSLRTYESFLYYLNLLEKSQQDV